MTQSTDSEPSTGLSPVEDFPQTNTNWLRPSRRLPRRADVETWSTGGSDGNWIVATGWKNQTGRPVTRFSSTWTVPQNPTVQAGQIIFIFNGMEPENQDVVLQPVLQWGRIDENDKPDHTGPFWTIASFLQPPLGNVWHSRHVKVYPGQVLTGLITRQPNTGATGFVYQCEFVGFPDTRLITPPMSELTVCAHVLEAYRSQADSTVGRDLDSRDHYPPDGSVGFVDIDITTDSPVLNGRWIVPRPSSYAGQFGQNISFANNATTNGRITIDFGRSRSNVLVAGADAPVQG